MNLLFAPFDAKLAKRKEHAALRALLNLPPSEKVRTSPILALSSGGFGRRQQTASSAKQRHSVNLGRIPEQFHLHAGKIAAMCLTSLVWKHWAV
jgi:hypothetical protein